MHPYGGGRGYGRIRANRMVDNASAARPGPPRPREGMQSEETNPVVNTLVHVGAFPIVATKMYQPIYVIILISPSHNSTCSPNIYRFDANSISVRDSAH